MAGKIFALVFLVHVGVVMGEKKKKFVKVCPNCLSPNLSVRIFDMGSYYDCRECGLKEFYPLEFPSDELEKAQKELKKTTVKKIKKAEN